MSNRLTSPAEAVPDETPGVWVPPGVAGNRKNRKEILCDT